jgi:hypothetical protein
MWIVSIELAFDHGTPEAKQTFGAPTPIHKNLQQQKMRSFAIL